MKIFLFAFAIVSFFSTAKASECVRVYYDLGPADYWIGRTYATFTQNLLGHFPKLQQIVAPIESYKKGDIETCRSTIYIGSYFDNKVPQDFYIDFRQTQKNVAWLGYNIWRPNFTEEIWGYSFKNLTSLNRENLDLKLQPTFYKNIDYKGERFFKYGNFSKTDPTKFLAAFEIAALAPQNSVMSSPAGGTEVLATAIHNFSNDSLPYILRNKNHFYVADVPFSFMHEADRYLIFADLLFDILNLPPRHTKKMAIIRMEDVHPLMPINLLYLFTHILDEQKVPITISMIPFFYDPQKLYGRKDTEEFVPASGIPEFVQWIKDAQKLNATFIWHGVTHQYGTHSNPHDGVTGADFEFWDAINNKPVPKDNPTWVLNRIFDGFTELSKVAIHPTIWLTPHYQASTQDNYIFSRVFPWNIGRVIYFNFDHVTAPIKQDSTLWLTDTDPNKQQKRLDAFMNSPLHVYETPWSGQMFPYEIYGDIHGQRILPENLGNSQPFENEHVLIPRSVQEIVADAKRNLVLRDTWASLFYHPFLFENFNDGGRGSYVGDPQELLYVITEIKKLGYEFIDVQAFANANQNTIRPEPIYLKKEVTP